MAIYKSPMDRVPEGWVGVNTYGVYRRGSQLVILGDADDTHNCDAMGCGSLDHAIIVATIPEWLASDLDIQSEITDHKEACPDCESSEVFYYSIPDTNERGYECDGCGKSFPLEDMPKNQIDRLRQAFDNGREAERRTGEYGKLGY